MSTNGEVAEVFRAIADLLDLSGERFKPEAYRRAARSIEGLGEDLRAVAARGELDQIPGVGDALREKILEYLKDGTVPYYERLRAQFPPGVLELMRLPGIGPKTTGRFYVELKVDSPSALLAAIDAGRLQGLAGFGERKIEKLRLTLEQAKGGPVVRTPLRTAWELARSIVRELQARTPLQSIDVAGSLRRRRESVGDLDILATSPEPPVTIGAFVALPGVQEVVLKGDTKATVRHAPGIQVDLRVVDPTSFGAALQYFTGSKDHNVRLRTIARERGLKINEYGVFRGEERVAGRTEEEVYATLGMPWIPPEIRENQGEIEAALTGTLPRLVGLEDLRGELHRHVSSETTPADLGALAEAARSRGLAYLGLVVRAESLTTAHGELIARLHESLVVPKAPSGPRVLFGLELPLDTIPPGATLPQGIDYLIATSPATGAPPATAPPLLPLFLAHLRLGSGEREVSGSSFERWLSWSRTNDIALEVTPDGDADGLDSGAVRRAVSAGGSIVLGAGGDDLWDLDGIELSVGTARRGSAPPSRVLNTQETVPTARPPARPRARRRAR